MFFKLLTVFVTSRCNLSCKACFYKNSLNKYKDLSISQWEEVAHNLSCETLLLSGGEPFLRKDLVRICRLFCPKHVIIPTNATVINYDLLRELCEVFERVSVSVSLDAWGETHNKLRGKKGVFEKVFDALGNLNQVKAEYKNFEIIVTTTISEANEKEIPYLLTNIRKYGLGVDHHFFEVIRRYSWNKDINKIRNLEKTHKTILDYYATGDKWLETAGFQEFFRQQRKVLKGQKWGFRCKAGDTFAVIDSNGDFKLCEFLPKVGNLLKQSIYELPTTEEAEKQIKKIKNHKCDCTHCVALAASMPNKKYSNYIRSVAQYGLKHYCSGFQ